MGFCFTLNLHSTTPDFNESKLWVWIQAHGVSVCWKLGLAFSTYLEHLFAEYEGNDNKHIKYESRGILCVCVVPGRCAEFECLCSYRLGDYVRSTSCTHADTCTEKFAHVRVCTTTNENKHIHAWTWGHPPVTSFGIVSPKKSTSIL